MKTKEGGWKCVYCDEIFRTRAEKQAHVRLKHPERQNIAWNKGLTKETNKSLKQTSQRLSELHKSGKIKNKVKDLEVRKKISDSLKRYFKNNPDKKPFVVCDHKNGESYAESYFAKWLRNENIDFIQEYHVKPYSLDFLINECVDLEIDGRYHRMSERRKQMDKHRDKVLTERGYKIIRVYWPDFKKLNKEEKKIFFKNLKFSLSNLNIEKFKQIQIDFINKNTPICQNCGKKLNFKDKRKFCSKKCANIHLAHKRKNNNQKKYKLSSDHRQKISNAIKGIYAGKNNPNYGKVWVYNETLHINKAIKKEYLESYILLGYKKGRKIKW